MQPAYARAAELFWPDRMAQVTRPAPATIIPTYSVPATRTPHLSSRMPNRARPPKMHRTL